ncbi:MAG: PadR family transcriptional regulator [Solirubrobacterales bacterium]
MAQPMEAMSIRHVVLGLIVERPSYGYQLGQRLDDRLPDWEWRRTGVYSALDTLERRKHIRACGQLGTHQTGRAASRRMYEATPKGQDFFRDWLLSPSRPAPVRQELDLKIKFSGPEILPTLIEQTWGQELYCMEQLKVLTSSHVLPGQPESWPAAAALLQRNAAIKMLQTRIEWLQEARSVMKLFEERHAGGRQ